MSRTIHIQDKPGTSSAAGEHWTTVITSKHRWFSIGPRELWEYRDLIGLFVYRDYVTYFKQTVLGPLWWVLQPVITSLAFVLVFSVIARGPTDQLPPALFYLAGLTVWFYFSNSLNVTANTFNANTGVFAKVYFPRLIVPIAGLITNLLKLGLQIGFFLVIYAIYYFLGYRISFHWSIVFLPLVILYLAALSMGIGLIFASFACKYRDLMVVLPFIIQIWMFISAIIIPMSAVPAQYVFLLQWNPVIPAVELFRLMTMGTGAVDFYQLLVAVLLTTIVLFWGIVSFSRAEKTFLDTV